MSRSRLRAREREVSGKARARNVAQEARVTGLFSGLNARGRFCSLGEKFFLFNFVSMCLGFTKCMMAIL